MRSRRTFLALAALSVCILVGTAGSAGARGDEPGRGQRETTVDRSVPTRVLVTSGDHGRGDGEQIDDAARDNGPGAGPGADAAGGVTGTSAGSPAPVEAPVAAANGPAPVAAATAPVLSVPSGVRVPTDLPASPTPALPAAPAPAPAPAPELAAELAPAPLAAAESEPITTPSPQPPVAVGAFPDLSAFEAIGPVASGVYDGPSAVRSVLATRTGRSVAMIVAVALAMLLFLSMHRRVDRNDPKLATARAETEVARFR